MSNHKTIPFPSSRIASIDVCKIGKQKHHIPAFIEVDVTTAREKIRAYRRQKGKVSFNAWLLQVIGKTLNGYESAAAFLKGKQKIVVFDDINISMVVEKKINGRHVPIPMIIERAQHASLESITQQIEDAKNQPLAEKDIVLQKKAGRLEKMYYHLPGFARRWFWKYMLSRPPIAYKKMGNVAVTSIGTMGRGSGWFIPISVHPVCFGISTINKKPVVVDNQIVIREMLHITILFDHDVIDGADMARFISTFTENIEKGMGLKDPDTL